MSRKIPFPPITLEDGWLGTLVPLVALLHCGNVWGAACNYQDIDIQCQSHEQVAAIYDNPGGTSITDKIALCPAPPATTTSVRWRFTASGNCRTDTPTGPVTCSDGTNNMVLTAPSPPGLASSTFSGKVPSGLGSFSVTATDAANSTINCKRTYNFNLQGTSGGWGEPHITTFDGIHYDFQSAGEFIALRKGALEIQTRQTPVATTSIPGANPYTGIAGCVSIYTAVAARVGVHRVSYQPNFVNGIPDPKGMQLRVDGVLTPLGPEGIDIPGTAIDHPSGATFKIPSAGRIVKSPIGDGIEIQYWDGTQLVVTPAYWDAQKKWYLNVNVYGTMASEGIMGMLAKGSWLPALPDGTSLGPKPDSLRQRYVDLYEKFANAWRVTDATSLFDYAPGTSTATFTLDEWPRERPSSCTIEGQPSAQSIDVQVAERHCSAIIDKNMKADCIFDVSVTGNPGFAQTYQLTEKLNPELTETMVKDDKDPTKHGESVTFTATVAPKLSRSGQSTPNGTMQFVVDGSKVDKSVALNSNGRAAWSTSSLQVGKHQVVAQYIPSGWGGLFLASRSAEESHTVNQVTSIKLKTNSSLCMGVKHKVSEGANVQLYNCSDTDVHKDWNIATSERHICQMGDDGAVYCIDFRAGAVDAIVTQEAARKDNQRWLYDPQDQKFHGHDPGMCLDVESQSPNSQVKVTKCEDWKQSQKWEIQ